ncbi:MAG: hypothetical protein ACUVRK_13000 [Spirochaetota bacterium]
MIHQIRIALIALIITVLLILLVTYYYAKAKQKNDLYAQKPGYQCARDCEQEYCATTGKQLDRYTKTQLLLVAYKTFVRGTAKLVLTTYKKPFNKFTHKFNDESSKSMHQLS